MKKEEFWQILQAAQAGDNDAMEVLLKLYEPLIRKHCYIGDILDEDLRQYIWMYIILNINRFRM